MADMNLPPSPPPTPPTPPFGGGADWEPCAVCVWLRSDRPIGAGARLPPVKPGPLSQELVTGHMGRSDTALACGSGGGVHAVAELK